MNDIQMFQMDQARFRKSSKESNPDTIKIIEAGSEKVYFFRKHHKSGEELIMYLYYLINSLQDSTGDNESKTTSGTGKFKKFFTKYFLEGKIL